MTPVAAPVEVFPKARSSSSACSLHSGSAAPGPWPSSPCRSARSGRSTRRSQSFASVSPWPKYSTRCHLQESATKCRITLDKESPGSDIVPMKNEATTGMQAFRDAIQAARKHIVIADHHSAKAIQIIRSAK
jgi:hypothetical protein